MFSDFSLLYPLCQGSPMPAITPASETNTLILEKVQSLLDDLDTASDKAPEGHVWVHQNMLGILL
ncbi:hypothetical protein FACS1894170_06950 [Planctomycetales bacterium]|nr:hypothetical protein FACS1894170_06950 [Planctomycetales bacterium]